MEIIQLLIGGIANGCVYGLIALGFVLIYKSSEGVNFAQGDMMMFGAFVALGFVNEGYMGLAFLPGVILACAVMGVTFLTCLMLGLPPHLLWIQGILMGLGAIYVVTRPDR